ncbi:hypothetical protein BC834DRAFT_876705 [Gloeopeniophorella convolvens]|nr:hypothetical protein BC834DRAFT_876705 [Gloeopeniophorella convolvens]
MQLMAKAQVSASGTASTRPQQDPAPGPSGTPRPSQDPPAPCSMRRRACCLLLVLRVFSKQGALL